MTPMAKGRWFAAAPSGLFPAASFGKCSQKTKRFALSFDLPHNRVLHHASNFQQAFRHQLLRPHSRCLSPGQTGFWPTTNTTLS